AAELEFVPPDFAALIEGHRYPILRSGPMEMLQTQAGFRRYSPIRHHNGKPPLSKTLRETGPLRSSRPNQAIPDAEIRTSLISASNRMIDDMKRLIPRKGKPMNKRLKYVVNVAMACVLTFPAIAVG